MPNADFPTTADVASNIFQKSTAIHVTCLPMLGSFSLHDHNRNCYKSLQTKSSGRISIDHVREVEGSFQNRVRLQPFIRLLVGKEPNLVVEAEKIAEGIQNDDKTQLTFLSSSAYYATTEIMERYIPVAMVKVPGHGLSEYSS